MARNTRQTSFAQDNAGSCRAKLNSHIVGLNLDWDTQRTRLGSNLCHLEIGMLMIYNKRLRIFSELCKN